MNTPLENACTHSTQKHSDKADSFTVKHFQEEGVPRSTLYQTLKPKEDGISAARQCGSGRPAKMMTKSGINAGKVSAKVARKMKYTQSLVIGN